MTQEARTLLETVLERLKQLENVRFDKDLAVPLKVAERNLGTWKNRGTIPWEKLLEYCRRKGVSLEWLINGRGPVNTADIVSEPGAIYQVDTDQDMVYAIAADVCAELEGRAVDPDKLAQCIKMLHREALQSGEQPPRGKVAEILKLL